MRTAFVDTIMELAENNEDLFLLTGDLGFSVFEDFRERFPKRFFNAGVAEQNMMGVSAGLALSGKTVIVYSIIPFVTMRVLEQIRNDICMQDLDVKIVGMGSGVHYGASGPSHHAIEDMSVMRSLPNMTVLSPGDAGEASSALKAAANHRGPVYIRLSKSRGSIEVSSKGKFEMGRGVLVREGSDITIVSCGDILHEATQVAVFLDSKDISVRLINMHTIKPVDKEILLKAAMETRAIVTIEEHSIIGGLGSCVAEVVAESDCNIMFRRFALPDGFIRDIGSRAYLLEKNSLSVDDLALKIYGEIG